MRSIAFMIILALAFDASAELARKKTRPAAPKHFRLVLR
jgi:hypothetical protein